MERCRKIILITTIFILGIVLFGCKNVNAALQANGGTAATYNLGSWIANVRKMEATGGTLGLSDTIDGTTLLSTASESNNLDIHMQKNTEYGAMAILSASAYGNPNKIENGGTTTGNKTGIYIYLNTEWVAAGGSNNSTGFVNANVKYKNFYSNGTYVVKPGDAITETKDWHGSTSNSWMSMERYSGIVRAAYGSIFSYSGNASGTYSDSGIAGAVKRSWATRAAIVVGKGF